MVDGSQDANYVTSMHIISPKTLRPAAHRAKDAAVDIEAWLSVVRRARWKNLIDLYLSFPDADYVKPCVVFNIRGNRYRLITRVYFAKQKSDGALSEGHVYVPS